MPASGIARGKSRLRAALPATERARLNRRLVRHGVAAAVAALASPGRCLVVSPCARVRRIARTEGARALSEGRPLRGLNAAIGQAVGFAARHGARRVLVLPVDLPRMSPASLDALLRRARTGVRRIVVPDRDAAGTNVLLIPARPGIDLHFGEGSFRRHLRSARESGHPALVMMPSALTQDIDAPEHLGAWIAAGRPFG